MNPNISFRPWLRPDGRYAFEVFRDGESLHCFVHWIDSSTKKICTASRGDICFSVYSKEEAEGNCLWLTNAYAEGAIGP